MGKCQALVAFNGKNRLLSEVAINIEGIYREKESYCSNFVCFVVGF